jgi:hypothetical protein
MNELIISAIMQNNNNRRFQELLSEAESERLYRQQTSRRPKLWQGVADRLIAVEKLLEPREREAIKPACACAKMA